MPPKAHIGSSATGWRTGDRQPTATQPDGNGGQWILRILFAPRRGAKKAEQKWASSTDPGYNRTWATPEAAIAAKAHFKQWVEHGRNPQQRTAQTASAVARAAAVAEARVRPQLPVRFSGWRWILEAVASPAA
eukprot:339291-Prymnesium_polylepis.1